MKYKSVKAKYESLNYLAILFYIGLYNAKLGCHLHFNTCFISGYVVYELPI